MLDHTLEPVVDHSWIPSSAWRSLQFPEQNKFAWEKADFLDDLPVMAATVLGLEMLLYEPCVDLRKASDLVLRDVGATIQTLRLVGKECDFIWERPGRMGDCIASLDMGRWFSALSARTFACDSQHSAATAVWRHSSLIAQYAQLVAESLDLLFPEDAYLVGLLHDVGAIPTALGWPNGGVGTSDPGASFAIEGSLPLFVLSALRNVKDSNSPSPWRFILATAHELAGTRTGSDASTHRAIHAMGTGHAEQEVS